MEVVHPDDLERVGEARAVALRDDATFEAIFRVRYSDGAYRWALGRSVPLHNTDGSVRERVGMLADIHAQQELQERLRISEECLRTAFQTGQVIAWEYDLSGQIITHPDNAMEIVGLGSSPVTDVLKRIHPEDKAQLEAAWNGALAEGTLFDIEFRFFRPDGRMIRLAAKGSVLRNLSTMPDRLVGITFDITDQKGAGRNGSDAPFRGDVEAHPPLEPGSAGSRPTGPSVTFEPTRLATSGGGEDAYLVRVGNCLVALLVPLDGTVGKEHTTSWFLEIGFGPWNQEGLIFATQVEAEDWVRARLPTAWKPQL